MDKIIYVDQAATTKMSKAAIHTMFTLTNNTWGNPSSLHSYGKQAKKILEESRSKIANFIGSKPQEIIFTSGGSESDNQAIISAAAIGKSQNKMHIISSAFEHHAVLNTLKQLEKQGFIVTLLNVHSNGLIRPEEVEQAIQPNTCLVSIMYANNEIGTIQPIQEIGKICKKHNVLFHTDAVQAIGHLPINVKLEYIDLLSASAHKFHGPKGTGFLYTKENICLSSLINGGPQEYKYRAGTENVPAIAAMATALEETNFYTIPKIIHSRDKIIKGLSEIPNSFLNGDSSQRLPGNINYSFKDIEGESLLLLLSSKGILASSNSACDSNSLEPSHVLTAIGRPHELAYGSLRITIDETIAEEEIDYIIKTVQESVERLRTFLPLRR